MSKTLELIFDFGSPNAYLVYKTLPALLERTGASLKVTPCLLGGIFKATGNKPPFVAYGEVKAKMAYERKEMQRFMVKHSIDKFRFNDHFPVNTLMLMRGALVAEKQGELDAYIQAGLEAIWENNLKMDDPEVYAEAMNAAGFDGGKLLEQMQDPDIKAKLAENTEQAVQRGSFGIPTFYVGEEMFFGKDRLDQVEEALLG